MQNIAKCFETANFNSTFVYCSAAIRIFENIGVNKNIRFNITATRNEEILHGKLHFLCSDHSNKNIKIFSDSNK